MRLLKWYCSLFDTPEYQYTEDQDYNKLVSDISGKAAIFYFGFYAMPMIFLMLVALIFMAIDPFSWFDLNEITIDWSRW